MIKGVISYTRDKRYKVDFNLFVLARPFGMKFYNFKMQVLNVSRSGMLLISDNGIFIPFKEGSRLNITFDVTCAHFERPIHMVAKVVRSIQKSDQGQQFGISIESIDKNHEKFYFDNLIKLSSDY